MEGGGKIRSDRSEHGRCANRGEFEGYGPYELEATLEEIVESERQLILEAETRYGKHYLNARACSIFLSRSIVSVELSHHETFGRCFSQMKKHHMLALLSTLRLHKVQSMMNLRQVLEAGAAAAFAIANPEMHHFVDVDEIGLLDPSKALAQKRYRWLDENFPSASQSIGEKKELINRTTSHANVVSADQTFDVDEEIGNIAAPFFDIEDEYHVQVDLWLIASIGVELMHLLYCVNQTLQRSRVYWAFPRVPTPRRAAERHFTGRNKGNIDTGALRRSPSSHRLTKAFDATQSAQ